MAGSRRSVRHGVRKSRAARFPLPSPRCCGLCWWRIGLLGHKRCSIRLAAVARATLQGGRGSRTPRPPGESTCPDAEVGRFNKLDHSSGHPLAVALGSGSGALSCKWTRRLSDETRPWENIWPHYLPGVWLAHDQELRGSAIQGVVAAGFPREESLGLPVCNGKSYTQGCQSHTTKIHISLAVVD